MSDAKNLYEGLVRQIDSDCANKNYSGSLDLCQSAGMRGGEKSRGAMGQHYFYESEFENGDKVDFEFEWYDKSKPFSIQPDIHRFRLSYKPKDGKPLSHSNAYEE